MTPESAVPPTFATLPEKLKTICVLIVEDQEEDYLYIKHLLDQAVFARYHVVWSANFEDGLRALSECKHDVALFDYNLGVRNGLELLTQAVSLGCDQPVILLTGHDSIEVDREALAAGASDYLCKSGITITLLERSIRYALRHSALFASVQKSQRQLDLFMRNVPCAVCIRDESGRYVFQNDRFRTHFENVPPQSLWRPSSEVEPLSFTEAGHHWLVNSFPMEEGGRSRQQGLTAIEITERVKTEELLLKTTGLLNGILGSLPIIVWSLDGKGRVLEARGSGLRRVGLEGEALAGRSFAALSTNAGSELAKAFKSGTANFRLPLFHQGREHFFDTFLHASDGPESTVVGFSIDITERRWLEKKILLVGDEERLRIGADLHDGLGQHLTGIACLSAALRERLRSQGMPEVVQADQVVQMVNQATVQTRALARGLCPVLLDKSGLPAALEHLVYQFEEMHGIECQFHSSVDEFECDSDSALHLFRITQEALNNAVRHGRARRIEVTLDSCARGRRLVIDDHGDGFNPQQTAGQAGVGLRLMHYRTSMIGGVFNIESQPQSGTRVECIFPFFEPVTSGDIRREG